MSEKIPEISQDEVSYIFASMTKGGLRVAEGRPEVPDGFEPAAASQEPTLQESYLALIDQGCTVEEIEVTHELKMGESGEVIELQEDDIAEIEEAIYEI